MERKGMAETVRFLIKKKGISVRQFCRDVEIGPTSFYHWDTQLPSVKTAIRVADYFDVSLDFLTGREQGVYEEVFYNLSTVLDEESRLFYKGKEIDAEQKKMIAKELFGS